MVRNLFITFDRQLTVWTISDCTRILYVAALSDEVGAAVNVEGAAFRQVDTGAVLVAIATVTP